MENIVSERYDSGNVIGSPPVWKTIAENRLAFLVSLINIGKEPCLVRAAVPKGRRAAALGRLVPSNLRDKK